MRSKPIRRDEVRFNGQRITTLPINSVREDKWGSREPVKRLWAPLLRSLNRAQQKRWRGDAERREAAIAAGFGFGFKAPAPVTCPQPYSSYPWPCTCKHCGRKFFRTRRSGNRFCSDRYAAIAHAAARRAGNAARVRALSAARAEARADLRCENCGAPIEAQRSTRRFCPGSRCRVAAHRAKAG